MLAGAAVNCPVMTPVPETATVAVVDVLAAAVKLCPPLPLWPPPEVETVAMIETEPLSAPLDVGAKVTATATLWPGARVSGTEIPLTLKLRSLALT